VTSVPTLLMKSRG